jgi:hypothetical protein
MFFDHFEAFETIWEKKFFFVFLTPGSPHVAHIYEPHNGLMGPKIALMTQKILHLDFK